MKDIDALVIGEVMFDQDIVWRGAICRHLGGTHEAKIKHRTLNGGWKTICNGDPKQIAPMWEKMWNEREVDKRVESTGRDLKIIDNSGAEIAPKELGDDLQPKNNHEGTKSTELVVSADSKCDLGSHLQLVADQINADFAIYKEHEKEATKYMLKIGLLMEHVKKELPHGQLNKWIQQNLTIGYRHAHRFRKLAQAFIEANQLKEGEVFALVDPANSQKELADRLQQMAFDFLGDKAQGELLEEYGIRFRDPKPLGGDHGGGQARAEIAKAPSAEAIAQAAELDVGALVEELRSLCISDRRKIHLVSLPLLRVLEGDLIDALKNVKALIKAG